MSLLATDRFTYQYAYTAIPVNPFRVTIYAGNSARPIWRLTVDRFRV